MNRSALILITALVLTLLAFGTEVLIQSFVRERSPISFYARTAEANAAPEVANALIKAVQERAKANLDQD